MRNAPVAILVALAMVVELVLVVGPSVSASTAWPCRRSGRLQQHRGTGLALFTQHLYFAFEIAAVILLVGIVAAIGLTTCAGVLKPSTRIPRAR